MDKTNSAERASPTKMPAENKQPPKTPPKTPPKPPPKPKVPQADEQKAAVDEKSTTDLKVSIAAPTTADEQQKVSDQQKAILAFKKAIRKPKADISEQKSSEHSTAADQQKNNESKLKEAESDSNSAQRSKKATEQVNVTQTKKTSERNNQKGEDQQQEKVKREEQQQLVTRDLEQQQKSLDALYAAAREEFDLDLSPTESAVKTLREGREMQKLSVIRNLAELLEAEPVETLQKVMPILQEVLNVEPSNLDMHYEASIVYKNCIKEPKLQRICPQLNDCLLAAILENIELQKENVSAAAWLESLADIAESIPQQLVVSMIVPVAIAQSDSTKRVQRRVISTRLIEKLASLVPREIVQRDLSPCAQILCQDPSTAVRTSIAQRIAVLAQALNSSADCCTLLLPCIIELCKDEEPVVREAILGSLAVCLPHFSKDAKKTVLLPLLRKCSEQALILRDASLPVIARYLGSWLQSLRDILAPTELRWWLDTYTRILDYATWQQNSQDEKNQQQQQPTINFTSSGGPTPPKNQIPNEQLRTSCRRMCAFNFPCMVATFGNDPAVFSEKLMPILERFCRDPDDEVRSTVASGFHEILEQRKLAVAGGQQPKTATGEKASATAKASTSSADQIPQLLNPFLELLSSGSSEVVQQLTGNLQRILPVLYSEISASGNRKTNSILSRLNQILVASDSLLRGTGSWRAHEAYLDSLAVLRNLVRPRELKQTFVPLLRQEVLTARALPCRVAAAKSLLLLMRHLPMAKDRQAIVDFFTQEVGQHPSCYRRRLLLDIVGPLLQHFSREFFIDKFLASILKLSADPISNIRLQLCRTLPAVKKYLLFPKDDQSLSNLERVVRDLLASEQSPLSRQLIQQSACELSRAETDQKESRANKAKLAEEKKLWTDHDPDEEEEEEEKGKKKAPKKQQHRHSSPESGISVAEEVWLPPKQQGGKPGLIRSVTAANVPEIQLQSSSPSNSKTSSKSLDTVAGMAIETSAPPAILGCVIGDSRPPPPQPSAPTTAPSWRNSRQGAPPKLAIVRPQPQVTITQRACSPMPPERKPEAGKTAGAADRGSKLPLSTGRHRPPAPVTNANSQVHQLASKFMGKDGTEPVTDSLKLKKYKPREGITTWAKSPQRLLQQGVSVQQQLSAQAVSRRGSTASEPSGSAGCGGMSRSASSAPAGGRAGAPLQASASSSSLGGRSSSASRRPYGLMKVQSTSSAVERKPAQIRCQVISMT